MKKMVYKYRVSKYTPFTEGLLFAIIAVIALALCLAEISANKNSQEILLPFCIAIVSMLMGFISMFRNRELPKEKI